MPAAAPVRKLSTNCVLPLLAAIAILPSVMMFCGGHVFCNNKTNQKSSTISSIMLFTDQPNQIGLRSQLDMEEEVTVPSGHALTARDSDCMSTSLVREQAEHNNKAVAQNVEQQLWPGYNSSLDNDRYDGFAAYYADDPVSNLFSNIGQLAARYFTEFCSFCPWFAVVALGTLVTLNFGFLGLSCSRWH